MDVGLITLDKAVGDQTGWFTYGYNNSLGAFGSGTVFNTAGYPATQGYDGLNMQYSSGRIDGLSSGGAGILFHDPSITIYGGQSGSPLWSPSNGVLYGVAVADSFAIRITPSVVNQIHAWVAGDTPPSSPTRVIYPPPSIHGGAYGVVSGGSLTLSQTQLLAGSFDSQGLPLSSYNVTNPTRRGTLSRNAWDGSYTYTPYPGLFGADSFTIQATDGLQVSNLATITINVLPPAVSPPANSMLLVAFSSGDFYQYNAVPSCSPPAQWGSAARAANGDMFYLVVFANGDLYQYDRSGVTYLFGGVKSACIALDPSGGATYEIVFANGDLYQVNAAGVNHLFSGVSTATITFSPTGAAVYEIVFATGELNHADLRRRIEWPAACSRPRRPI